jgi:hypothetical protein
MGDLSFSNRKLRNCSTKYPLGAQSIVYSNIFGSVLGFTVICSVAIDVAFEIVIVSHSPPKPALRWHYGDTPLN